MAKPTRAAHAPSEAERNRHNQSLPMIVAESLKAEAGETAARFACLCLARVPGEDLVGSGDAALVAAMKSFFAFSRERAPAERKVRVFNPSQERDGWTSPYSILEVVGEDMPFLLDSILAALSANRFDVEALWHPVMAIKRDHAGRLSDIAEPERGAGAQKESLIHVEFGPAPTVERLAEIEATIRRVLADVGLAVRDWRPMLAALDQVMADLEANPPSLPADEVSEALAFLDWLRADHFTFLGCRDYVLKTEEQRQTLEMLPHSGLGLLTDPERRVVRRGADRVSLSPELQAFINEPAPLIITKANTRSTVHRPVHMDYIGVKRFGPNGAVMGERRFIGLFTSAAYTRNTREIPYLRHKVMRALARAGFAPDSHDGKAYLNILETFPRDELFQVTEDELFENTVGILRLMERPRTKIFVRRDKFDRFVSVLVYVPRERYSTNLRERIMDILVEAYNGRASAYYPTFGDEPLARIHFIIGRNDGKRPEPDATALEARIREAVRTWDDALSELSREKYGETEGARLFERCRGAFNASYRDAFSAEEALTDYAAIEAMRGRLAVRAYRLDGDDAHHLRLKLYHRGGPVVLSEVLPILERLGLRVIKEETFPLEVVQAGPLVIHDFTMLEPMGRPLSLEDLKDPFERTFIAVWMGLAESDGLNRLVLRASLGWRDVSILRTIARFLRQAAIAFSLEYMEDALGNNSVIASAIVRLFHSRLDPHSNTDENARRHACAAIHTEIEQALEAVTSLDEDRILRRFVNVVDAILRTNFYQRQLDGSEKSTIAIKLSSPTLLELPAPVPLFEIFVYSPSVEAVHLRFGKVARGGLRWSDRREDFRAEILDLVKAQRVKNAVIVPVGAKGGFFPKALPQAGTREAREAEAIRCYKLFIASLLDVTDNIVSDTVVAPGDTVRHDGDDPYLVVAADKGTATFSDIANAIALERGFWLGDAFASGGSEGYDHKKMGITARGAWEAIKRHFRELGTDIQTTPFRVIGVGDMSGDVFGNAMLLSEKIRLVAAFDHRDIFIDPEPGAAKSFLERKRLFEKPRSSWADYDKALISKGGGVFSRTLKAIALTPEIMSLSGLAEARVTPAELVRALLKAPMDLLYFGGIGTYIKASHETNLEVGDRANDALRVDGRDVRAKVVGEGANLGVTQRGRIEFARKGGRINTDAIDNSAGVDTSDHEVNIKIALDSAISDGSLLRPARRALLNEMEADVARLVLIDNYRQTLALTVCDATAAADLSLHARLMETLGRTGVLDRGLERLPDRDELAEREKRGEGLSRPELAVLLAYAKITLFEALIASQVPDEPYFARDLVAYFPPVIAERFPHAIERHRLRREIIATVLANRVVNIGGPALVQRLCDETGVTSADVVRAFVVTCAAYGMDALYDSINALDNGVPASLQTALHLEVKRLVDRQALWFLRNGSQPLAVEQTVAAFAPAVQTLSKEAEELLSNFARRSFDAQRKQYVAQGVDEDLARRIALLDPLAAATDVVEISRQTRRGVLDGAAAYFVIGEALGLDRLVSAAEVMKLESHWEALARGSLLDELGAQQRALAATALVGDALLPGRKAAEKWVAAHARGVENLKQMIADFEAGGVSIAKLTVAAGALKSLSGDAQ